jgi:hypothetical protein
MSVSIYLSFIYIHSWDRELGGEPQENHQRTERTGSVSVLRQFSHEFSFSSRVFKRFSQNTPFQAPALSASIELTTVRPKELRHAR